MENLSLNNEATDQLTKFTPDIITEILLRLPVKPLSRFKCVSKEWLSLIHSRPFIHRQITHSLSGGLHLARFIGSTLSIVDLPSLNSTPVKTIHLPFSAQSGTADLAGSCHGLVLISDHPVFAAVYNPSNLTYHILPFNDTPRRWHESHWVDFGLGFDFFSQDYKFVRVDQDNGPGPAYPARVTQIFSLKLNQWKKIKADFPHFLASPKGHGKFSNNCLHWMSTINPPGSYDLSSLMTHPGQADPTVYKYIIVALNLFTETFLEIPTPDFYAGGHEFPVPTLVSMEREDDNNTLMVSVEFGPMEYRSIDVWVMKKYGVKDSWAKILTFHHGLTRPEAIGRAKAVTVSKDECEVLMEENDRPAKYFWVHRMSGRVREVEIQGKFSGIFSWCGGHPCDFGSVAYVESVVRLKNVGLEHSPEPDYEEEVSERLSGKGRIYIDPIKDERVMKEHNKMRRKLMRMPTVMYLKEPLRRN